MKLVLGRDALQKGLQVIQGIVESKTTMPILSHMLLTASDTAAAIAATDLDIAVREPLEAEIVSPGSVCIPARKLYEIVRELPSPEITLETQENNWILLTSGKSRFKLIGLAEADFPAFPSLPVGDEIRFEAQVLRQVITKTLYATGESDARYTLNGLMIHLNPQTGEIRIVGTDGHRLSAAYRPLPTAVSSEKKVILPKKAASELRKLIESLEGEVGMILDKNHAAFVVGEVLLISRLIEGSYPNYEQVIPKGNEHRLVASREEFLGAIRRASLLGREKTFAIKLELKDDTAVFSSSNPDLGEVNEQIQVRYGGGPLTLGFNARYMLDALQHLDGEEVLFEIQDSLSPTLIREADRDDYRCVIMPMRV